MLAAFVSKLGMVGKYETMYDGDSGFQVLFSSAVFKITWKVILNLFNLNNLN